MRLCGPQGHSGRVRKSRHYRDSIPGPFSLERVAIPTHFESNYELHILNDMKYLQLGLRSMLLSASRLMSISSANVALLLFEDLRNTFCVS